MAEDRPARWTINLPGDTGPLTPNRRKHWRHYNDRVAVIRRATAALVREAKVPAMEHVKVTLVCRPPTRHRRDSDNLVPYLLKPVKDGIVDAGVVPDDTDHYMTAAMPKIVLPVKGDANALWAYSVTLEPGLPPAGTNQPPKTAQRAAGAAREALAARVARELAYADGVRLSEVCLEPPPAAMDRYHRQARAVLDLLEGMGVEL